MCLAIPMRIIELDGQTACCEAGGVRREVSLYLLPPGLVEPGDFVIVHVGYAIQKLAAHEATTTWDMLDRMTQATTAGRDA
jgi:hydrogenase expression/formation protein HypC